jgi:AcrR family transcriptional regulator
MPNTISEARKRVARPAETTAVTRRVRVHASVKSQRKVHDRRAALVGAAKKIFMKKGFHAATVREIGEAAGLTQGTIYNYVRSKDDILYLVCDEAITAYQDAVREALQGVERHRRLQTMLPVLIEVVHQHQDNILLMYQVSHLLNRRALHAILAKTAEFNAFASHILTETLGHEVSDMNRTLAANILTFLPAIVAVRRWDLRGKVTLAEMKEGLSLFLSRGFGVAR